MDRKAVLEVRKLFDKNDCRIDRMRGCYVNGEKQIIADLQDRFYSFEDEELFQYCELFKKAVSGRIGRTLFNIEFPLAEEKEGGGAGEAVPALKERVKGRNALTGVFSGDYSELFLCRELSDSPGARRLRYPGTNQGPRGFKRRLGIRVPLPGALDLSGGTAPRGALL